MEISQFLPLSIIPDVSTMANETKLLRMRFGDLAVGQSFYDPVSAEYFVKRTDKLAAMISGMGDGTVPDEFDADDIVGIGQN